MKLLFHSDGVPGFVPTGYALPQLIDSNGRLLLPVFFYVLHQIATNAWTSDASARTICQRLLDIFAYFEDNHIPFESITVEKLTEYREFKLKHGIEGKICTQLTVNQAIDAFKSLWKWCVRNGRVVDTSPVSISNYRVKTRGLPAFGNVSLPLGEDIAKHLNVLRGPEERIATGLFFGAGLRRAEVVGLPADIILPIEKLEMRCGAVRLFLDGHHAPTKGSRERFVEIPERLYGEMTHYLMSNRRASRVERANVQPKSLLVSKYGCEYKPGWANDFFTRANQLTGFSLYPHLLRHWYSTRFLEYETPDRFGCNEDAALNALQGLLGHGHPDTTRVYTHLAVVESSEKVKKISRYQENLNRIIDEGVSE
ncbi:site-specific integrase [Paraburkholderia sp. RL18-101-BIB-B]|uniref:tyrosine-type recombinase/integrase n=1 Tax=Paraburkholderia sp. RL18-101-BIB-B TaxID=3031634 RepID=UPI0038BC7FC4